MSVKPLVENAVRHRSERHAVRGRIEIAARVVSDDVELRVSDDGCGIEPERLPAVLAAPAGASAWQRRVLR